MISISAFSWCQALSCLSPLISPGQVLDYNIALTGNGASVAIYTDGQESAADRRNVVNQSVAGNQLSGTFKLTLRGWETEVIAYPARFVRLEPNSLYARSGTNRLKVESGVVPIPVENLKNAKPVVWCDEQHLDVFSIQLLAIWYRTVYDFE